MAEKKKRTWHEKGVTRAPLGEPDQPRIKIQRQRTPYPNHNPTLPRQIVSYAIEEFHYQGNTESAVEIQDRGGLNEIEIISLLADAIERQRDVIFHLTQHDQGVEHAHEHE